MRIAALLFCLVPVIAFPQSIPAPVPDNEVFKREAIDHALAAPTRRPDTPLPTPRMPRRTMVNGACPSNTMPRRGSPGFFLSRADSPLARLTLDDPRLQRVAIGVQMIGNNSMNTPPAHAMASRGIVDNVRGYMVYGDSSRANPTDAIIDAVVRRHIDVALVWGPLAGYVAHRSTIPLRIEAVTPADDARWPMTFDISMGVKRNNGALLEQLNASLEREQSRIHRILEDYSVPLITIADR